MKKSKKILIIALSVILAFVLVINPICAVVVYESIFGGRYETAEWLKFSVDDFDSLSVERVDIEGENTLAGYKYFNPNVEASGVVVVAHGLGGGGHNTYMPFIDAFTDNGYFVFAYDATGNDNSEGDGVKGLPQGVIDLESAINKVYGIAEYNGLPLYLFGHSWGAYSVGAVLNIHPEVKGAVMFSGFNESSEMIKEGASDMIGDFLTNLTLPYVLVYEKLKFGDYTDMSVLDGIENTDAKIMIVHSLDDATVPAKTGFDMYYESYHDDPRVKFTLFKDKGHNYLFYSEAAWEYRDKLNANYIDYVEKNGGEYTAELKVEFMSENLDKSKCFEPDPEIMQSIFEMFS